MNEVGQKVFNILKSELSEITSRSLLETKCKEIGRNTDALTLEDIKKIKAHLLSSVLLFGGAEKASVVKEKVESLLNNRHF